MQHRRRFFAGFERINDRRQTAIFDAHKIGRVLGQVSIFGKDQRHRLADISHAVDGERPLMHRRLECNQERIGKLLDLFACDHSPHAVPLQRLARIDADDVGMRMARADDVGV